MHYKQSLIDATYIGIHSSSNNSLQDVCYFKTALQAMRK